jgi:hypothetical protein
LEELIVEYADKQFTHMEISEMLAVKGIKLRSVKIQFMIDGVS